ncbi:MAG: YHS domain-containing protein [Thermodesulfobacteriota bacterium]
MWRFLLFIVLASILYYVLRFFMKYTAGFTKKTKKDNAPEELVQDPYCQTYIPKSSALKKRIGGKEYYFCNAQCLRKYLEKSKS